MRNYYIPPEADEKEKIIGGIMTNGQLIIVVAGALLGAGFVGLTFNFIGAFSLVPGILLASISVPFAFYKKDGLSLITIIRRRRKFNAKSKFLVNKITKNNRNK